MGYPGASSSEKRRLKKPRMIREFLGLRFFTDYSLGTRAGIISQLFSQTLLIALVLFVARCGARILDYLSPK